MNYNMYNHFDHRHQPIFTAGLGCPPGLSSTCSLDHDGPTPKNAR